MTVPLPALRKTVLYLDQNAISNMMKAIHPAVKSQRQEASLIRWRELFRRVDRLCKLQLLVCPRSPSHVFESAIYRDPAALTRMCEQLASGVRLLPAGEVRSLQLALSVRCWAGRGEDADTAGLIRDVLSGDPHGWTSPLTLSVEVPLSEADRSRLRITRQETGELLFQLTERRWKTELLSFDDWYRDELHEFGRLILVAFDRFSRAYFAVVKGGCSPDSLDLNDIAFRTVSELRRELRDAGQDDEGAELHAREYLDTDAYVDVPSIRIGALIYAARARKAGAGQVSSPSPGFCTDVETISSYLPYCDAMFVDNECRALLAEEPIRSRLNYATKVFSVSTWDQFTQYLDDLFASCSEEHRRLVRSVYGDGWEEPYETMYATGST